MQWEERKDIVGYETRMINAAAVQGQGVAILLEKHQREWLGLYCRVKRLILVGVQTELADVVIIEIYMLTSAHEDTVAEIYKQLNYLIEAEKWSCNWIVMGDGTVSLEKERMERKSHHLNMAPEMGEEKGLWSFVSRGWKQLTPIESMNKGAYTNKGQTTMEDPN